MAPCRLPPGAGPVVRGGPRRRPAGAARRDRPDRRPRDDRPARRARGVGRRDTITVRGEDGTPVVIDRRLIVSGKPVPPRPSVRPPASARTRWRSGAADVLAGARGRAASATGCCGPSAGFSLRANSALLAGDPGLPWDDALAGSSAFYAVPRAAAAGAGARRLRGGDRLQDAAGLRPGRAPTWSCSWRGRGPGAARRTTGGRAAAPPVQLDGPGHRGVAGPRPPGAGAPGGRGRRCSRGRSRWRSRRWPTPRAPSWPRAGPRCRSGPTSGPGSPTSGSSPTGGAGARARRSWARSWAGPRSAAPPRRTSQATEDNHPALALYERLGFVTHHTYRYLRLG